MGRGTQVSDDDALRLRRSANVAICSRTKAAIDETAAQIGKLGVQALGVQADMSKGADVERFMKAVIERFGRVDILVNNAGTSKRGAFLELTDEEWAADIELKVFGAIRCTRLVVPHMKKQGGGRIITSRSRARAAGGASYPTSVARAAGLALQKRSRRNSPQTTS